jgi:hypothetical protein
MNDEPMRRKGLQANVPSGQGESEESMTKDPTPGVPPQLPAGSPPSQSLSIAAEFIQFRTNLLWQVSQFISDWEQDKALTIKGAAESGDIVGADEELNDINNAIEINLALRDRIAGAKTFSELFACLPFMHDEDYQEFSAEQIVKYLTTDKEVEFNEKWGHANNG